MAEVYRPSHTTRCLLNKWRTLHACSGMLHSNQTCLVQFPYAASYPLGGMEPPIITSCLSFASNPCSSTSGVIALGEITFDATKPTLNIIKVSEQYGDPTTNPTRKLQQNTQPLFVSFLFNFSKAGAYATALLCIKDAAITMVKEL